MADISKINVNGSIYSVKDRTARELISDIDTSAIIISATAPSDTTKLWRSSIDNQLRFYNGTGWEKASGGIEYAALIKDWRVNS